MAFRAQRSMKESLVIRYSFNKEVECLLIYFPVSSPPCPPWPPARSLRLGERDMPVKYCNCYVIYKSWQYNLSIACQVWARGATYVYYADVVIMFSKRILLQ